MNKDNSIKVEAKRCKWCGKKLIELDLEKHENECDLNDGGKSDMNYEDVANKYF